MSLDRDGRIWEERPRCLFVFPPTYWNTWRQCAARLKPGDKYCRYHGPAGVLLPPEAERCLFREGNYWCRRRGEQDDRPSYCWQHASRCHQDGSRVARWRMRLPPIVWRLDDEDCWQSVVPIWRRHQDEDIGAALFGEWHVSLNDYRDHWYEDATMGYRAGMAR